MSKLSRREFMTSAVASAAVISTEGILEATEARATNKLGDMPLRQLGKTGLNVSILGFGTFRLMEALPCDVHRLVNYYLDSGGNFIDTAMAYGDVEHKLGPVIRHRRDDCIITSKAFDRSKAGALKSLEKSLSDLKTDHVDIFYIHSLENLDELNTILAEDGALAGLEDARRQGKIRFIGVSGHKPEVLVKAVQSYPFDVVMQVMNYYDYFNYPLTYESLIPLCQKKGVGLVAMKSLAGGLLYRNANFE